MTASAGTVVSDVVRRFRGRPPITALDAVDLTVPPGQLAAVLGPSGCGKSTLLRVVAGIERPDAGTVSIDGVVVAGPGLHVPPERRSVGLVPQEGALFPHLDVAGNIGFGLSRRDRAGRGRRVDEMLELVGLTGFGRRRPHELSGGQQQRVALARALAPDPALVLLDEPFSALDTSLRASLRTEVAAMLRAAGATAVLVTHDQAEALSIADSVAVMRDGRITQHGTPTDVYHRAADEWTGRFVGSAVTLRGTFRPGPTPVVECVAGRLAVSPTAAGLAAGEVTVFIRPEQIWPATDGVAATVTARRFEGAEISVDLAVGSDRLSARWPTSRVEPSIGDVVPVEVIGEVLVFPLA